MFVNFEQNDWARLLPIAELAYNNVKNASIGHTPFELNCGYHPRVSYKKNVDLHPRVSYKKNVDLRSKSKSVVDLANNLRELMIVCRENFQHT